MVIDDWDYQFSPADREIDRVREEIGDVDEERKLISDSTIQFHLDNESSFEMACYRVAKKIAARFRAEPKRQGRDFTEDRSVMVKHYDDLAADLLRRAPQAIPRAANILIARRDAIRKSTTLTQPTFEIGMLGVDRKAIEPTRNLEVANQRSTGC